MPRKCEICNEKIEEDEMGKLAGTIVKVKNKEGKNERRYICRECQINKKDREMIKNR